MKAHGTGTKRTRVGTPVELARAAGRRLIRRGLTLGVAESCTGGLLGAWLTEIPGSSRYFRGGIVAYANAAKTRLLGVPREVLSLSGAVSAAVAVAMARGVRRALGADIGIAITGIAGPDGGSAQKPVGLVYMAVEGRGGVAIRECRFRGGRSAVRRAAARGALDLLQQSLRKMK